MSSKLNLPVITLISSEKSFPHKLLRDLHNYPSSGLDLYVYIEIGILEHIVYNIFSYNKFPWINSIGWSLIFFPEGTDYFFFLSILTRKENIVEEKDDKIGMNTPLSQCADPSRLVGLACWQQSASHLSCRKNKKKDCSLAYSF